MPYQTFITPYPAMQVAGESHNNARHTSIYQTCHNPNNALEFGTIQVQDGLYDHTRWLTADPTAANVVDGAELVVVSRCRNAPNPYGGTRFGDSAAAAATGNFNGANAGVAADCQYLAMRRGVIWVVVEKPIDPSLPVFVRVDNPANAAQGIGFLTDTADGANTVEITSLISRDTKWCGTDNVSFLSAKDPNITPITERPRTGLTRGYSIAPLSLKYV